MTDENKITVPEKIYYDGHRPGVNKLWVGPLRVDLGTRLLDDTEMDLVYLHRILHDSGVVDCRKPQKDAIHQHIAESWQRLRENLEKECGVVIIEFPNTL